MKTFNGAIHYWPTEAISAQSVRFRTKHTCAASPWLKIQVTNLSQPWLVETNDEADDPSLILPSLQLQHMTVQTTHAPSYELCMFPCTKLFKLDSTMIRNITNASLIQYLTFSQFHLYITRLLFCSKTKVGDSGTASRAAASPRQKTGFNPGLGCYLYGVCMLCDYVDSFQVLQLPLTSQRRADL